MDQPVHISNWQPKPKEIAAQTWAFSDLIYCNEIEQHEGPLTRDFIRSLYSPACSERAVIWTLVWGYPKGRIQLSRPNMRKAILSASRVADAISDMRRASKPIAANDALALIHNVSTGIKTSTSSKIAYFAGLKTQQGQCLILDEKVIGSILYSRFDQLRPLIRKMLPRPPASYRCLGEQIEDVKKRQAQIYGDYVLHMNRLAEKQGIASDALEAFLFANGPDRKTSTAINDEWDAIRGRSRRKPR
jgi:hypothetical protein